MPKLDASTKDDTFTFITGDTMLKGYDQALAAFRETYAMLKGQTNQDIEKRVRVLSPDVVRGCLSRRAGLLGEITRPETTTLRLSRSQIEGRSVVRAGSSVGSGLSD